jgi:predicted transposase/invertase (TIGR01784 family)
MRVMKTGIVPTSDYVFKRVCGDEGNALVLVDVLNAVLRFPPGRAVRGVTLLNPFVPGEQAGGKESVLDVRARDDPGRQFVLESQRLVRPVFPRRALFYWCKAHLGQLEEGDRHEMLQPTYVICFLGEALFPDTAYHHRFHPYDEEHGVLLCKDLEVHLLELSKFDLPAEEVKTALERWVYFFKHGAELDPEALPATLDVPVIRQALEVLVRISQNELERQRALDREMAQRDAASLEYAYREMREEARVAREAARAAEEAARAAEDKARAAREVGLRLGRIQAYQQLLGLPQTPSDELAQLAEEESVRLEESLRSQLTGRTQANGAPPAGPS